MCPADTARAHEYAPTAAIPGQLFASLIDTAPGSRPLRTCVGIDMGVRALNDTTKDIGLNTLTAPGLPLLQNARTAAPAQA